VDMEVYDESIMVRTQNKLQMVETEREITDT